MPPIDHTPPALTVVVAGEVELLPSVTTTEIVAPTSPVPLTAVSVALPAFTGLVTVLMSTVGPTVSFLETIVSISVVPLPVAVAV